MKERERENSVNYADRDVREEERERGENSVDRERDKRESVCVCV